MEWSDDEGDVLASRDGRAANEIASDSPREIEPPYDRADFVRDPFSYDKALQDYYNKPPVTIAIIGMPGVGRSRLAQSLCQHFNFEYIEPKHCIQHEISTQSKLGLKIANYLKQGKSLDSNDTLRIIRRIVHSERVKFRGYVMDGLPQSTADVAHMLAWERHMQPQILIELFMDEDELTNSMRAIGIHSANGERAIILSTDPPLDFSDPSQGENSLKLPEIQTSADETSSADEELSGEPLHSSLLTVTNAADVVRPPELLPDAFRESLEAYRHFRESTAVAALVADREQHGRFLRVSGSQSPSDIVQQVLVRLHELAIGPVVEPIWLAPDGNGPIEADARESESLSDSETADSSFASEKEAEEFSERILEIEPFQAVENAAALPLTRTMSIWGDYCPVAFWQEKKLVRGNPKLAAAWMNEVYFLSTPTALRAFMENPKRFLVKPPSITALGQVTIAVIGPPCSGRTTHASLLGQLFTLPVIDVRELALREMKNPSNMSALGSEISKRLCAGKHLTVDICVSLIKNAVQSSEKGWVLDGFPCSTEQAIGLVRSGIVPQHVVLLEDRSENPEYKYRLAHLCEAHTTGAIHVGVSAAEALENTTALDSESTLMPDSFQLPANFSLQHYESEIGEVLNILKTASLSATRKPRNGTANAPKSAVRGKKQSESDHGSTKGGTKRVTIVSEPRKTRGQSRGKASESDTDTGVTTDDDTTATATATDTETGGEGDETGTETEAAANTTDGELSSGSTRQKPLQEQEMALKIAPAAIYEISCAGSSVDTFGLIQQAVDPFVRKATAVSAEHVAQMAEAMRAWAERVGTIDKDEEQFDGQPVQRKVIENDPLVRCYGDCKHYCPVTLKTSNTLAPGLDEWAATYSGRLYKFAGEDELRRFLEHPGYYLAFGAPTAEEGGNKNHSQNVAAHLTLAEASPPKPPPPRLWIVGPAGSGKSTLCKKIHEQHGLVHVVIDDTMRSSSNEDVDDDTLVDHVVARLSEPECQRHGYVLDGFPDSSGVAQKLIQKKLYPDAVVVLETNVEDVVQRTFKEPTAEEQDTAFREKFSEVLEALEAEEQELQEAVHEDSDDEERENAKRSLNDRRRDLELRKMEVAAELRESIKQDIRDAYNTQMKEIAALKDALVQEFGLSVCSVDTEGAKPRTVYARMLKTLPTGVLDAQRASLLASAYAVDIVDAQRMLSAGFVSFSKFGSHCPVKLHESNGRELVSVPASPSYASTAFPAVYRRHVYYMSSAEAREKFLHNPVIYTASTPPPPLPYSAIPPCCAVIGAPLGGKSTIAKRLEQSLGIVRVSPGKALRKILSASPDTPGVQMLRERIITTLRAGKQVTDAEIIKVLRWHISTAECQKRGWVLDGFPANFRQLDDFEQSVTHSSTSSSPKQAQASSSHSALGLSSRDCWPQRVFVLDATDDVIAERAKAEYIRRDSHGIGKPSPLLPPAIAQDFTENDEEERSEEEDIAEAIVEKDGEQTVDTSDMPDPEAPAHSNVQHILPKLSVLPCGVRARTDQWRAATSVATQITSLSGPGVLVPLEAAKSRWWLADAVRNEMLVAAETKRNFVGAVRDGRAARAYGIGIPSQRIRRKLGKFAAYCPVKWVDHKQLVDGVDHCVAVYCNRFYCCSGEEELERFLRHPSKYVVGQSLPTALPRRLSPSEAAALPPDKLALKGYCPVTMVTGRGPTDEYSFLRGDPAAGCVEYDGKFYVFHNEEKLRAFMRTPAHFVEYARLPEKIPLKREEIDFRALPLGEYLEFSVFEAVDSALSAVSKLKRRPLFPFKSPKASVLLYMAIFLKSINPESKLHTREKYATKMEEFLAQCELVPLLAPQTLESIERSPQLRKALEEFNASPLTDPIRFLR